MRLLILGGSQFLGRAIASHACATRDASPARQAGLTTRPLAVTARDTLDWLLARNGPVIGLTSDEERDVLVAWHAEQATKLA
jgi:hypothetical protein